jgi:CHASE2 domain-containing sensor protein
VDRHRTPFSVWAGDEMLGLMIHGQITAQLLDGRSYSELGPTAARALVIALALTGFALGWIFWRQRLDLTGRTIATVALVVVDALAYSQLRIILPFTLALTAWLIGVAGGHHLRSLVSWVTARSNLRPSLSEPAI